jgi:hypothetical protein
MEIPTQLVKDGRAAHAAISADMAQVEQIFASQVVTPEKTLTKDFLPAVIAIAFIALVVGLIFGTEIGKHLH